MKSSLKGLIVFTVVVAGTFASGAHASGTTFTGTGNQITTVMVNADADGTLRVGINIQGATTACSVLPGWFATTSGGVSPQTVTATDPLVRAGWLNLLKAIKAGNRSFQIKGTGTCDVYGAETLSFVQMLN